MSVENQDENFVGEIVSSTALKKADTVIPKETKESRNPQTQLARYIESINGTAVLTQPNGQVAALGEINRCIELVKNYNYKNAALITDPELLEFIDKGFDLIVDGKIQHHTFRTELHTPIGKATYEKISLDMQSNNPNNTYLRQN